MISWHFINYFINCCLISVGYLLPGQKLDDAWLEALIALQRSFFIPDPVVPKQQTPTPSPPQPPPSIPGKPTVDTNNDPWSISAEDLTPTLPQSLQPIMDKNALFQIWCTFSIQNFRHHWLVLWRWLFSLCTLSCVFQCTQWYTTWWVCLLLSPPIMIVPGSNIIQLVQYTSLCPLQGARTKSV